VSANGSEIMQQNEAGGTIVAALKMQRIEAHAWDSPENFRQYSIKIRKPPGGGTRVATRVREDDIVSSARLQKLAQPGEYRPIELEMPIENRESAIF